MADFLTLEELVTINDRNLADVDIPDFLNSSTFMRTNAAVTASHDTIHKWLTYQNPNTGFRTVNTGRELDTSVDTFQSTDCVILDGTFMIDMALAESYRKGGSTGWVNREASRALDSAFFKAEVQVFNGRSTGDPATSIVEGPGTGGGDDAGFMGLPNYTTLGSLAGGADGTVVNAGGSTNCSSVYLIRSGPADVEIITGRSGDISIGTTTVQQLTDSLGPPRTSLPVLYTPIQAWYAMKIGKTSIPGGGGCSAVRIANIDDGSNTVTDDLIFGAMSRFGAGQGPTHIYMNRRSVEQLRSSRTATNQTGSPAPYPAEVGGVPIMLTDGLINSETALV